MTIPKFYSCCENHIGLYNIESGVDVRGIYMEGVTSYIRVTLNPDDSCVYYNSNTENGTNNDVLENYKELFECLNKKFFYGETHIYGVIKEEKFLIYDILTNDNYLSVKDMIKIRDDYNYSKLNFELLESIISGDNFDTLKVIKYIANNNINVEKFYILPSVYLANCNMYTDLHKADAKTTFTNSEEKYIIGTKPVKYSTTRVWNSKKSTYENFNADNFNKKTQATNAVKRITASDKINKILTKDERLNHLKDTLINVNDYIKTEKIILTKDESNAVQSFCYLFALTSHAKTRSLFEDFLWANISFIDTDDIYSSLIKYWEKEFPDSILRLHNKKKFLNEEFIKKIFCQEVGYLEALLGDYLFDDEFFKNQ